ncbi:MAG: hypothetical protein SNJ84_10640, partial [Verrucomicrobiia bacterium]
FTVPLLTSVFIHGGILVLLGGAVLVPGIIPKAPFVGEMVVPSALEPTDDVPVDDFLMEDAPVVDMPAIDLPEIAPAAVSAEQTFDVIATATSLPTTTFSLPVGSGVVGTGTASFGVATGTGQGSATPSAARGMRSFFGSSEVIEGGLRGVFYDLKRQRNGSPAPGTFVEKVRAFTRANWQRSVLDRHFRVSREMFATQFYIPRMPAEEAPKAFEVQNEVEPRGWVILYSGLFSPPSSGRYRLVGYADDLLLVRVDGQLVLNGSRRSSRDAAPWTPDPDGGFKFRISSSEPPPNGGLAFGNWMNLEREKNYTIEILLGENPGGSFEAFLFVEQEGRNYKKLPDGRPILPLFRTAREGIRIQRVNETQTPSFDDSPSAPVFAPVAR